MKSLRRLIPYLKSYRRSLGWGLLWLAATNALGLLIPWMLKEGVDAVPSGRYRAIALFAAILAAAALLRGGTRIASRLHFLHTARHIEVDLRRDLLERLLEQDAPFFDSHRTGDILSRFTNDLANVRMMAGFGVMTLLNAALVYLFTLALLLTLSPSLTAIALIPYPLMLLAVKRLSRSLLYHSSLVQEGLGRVSEAVEEGVSGQAVVRAGGLAQVRARRFSDLNDDYLERNLALARLRSLVLPVMTLVGPLGTLLALYFGGVRVASGNLSLGDLVAFNAYLVQLTWPTLLLGWVLTLMQRSGASMTRLETFLDLPRSNPGPSPQKDAPAAAPEVEFRGLDFAYGETMVLQDLRFRVHAGRLVGVTGPTASGKTTLLRLLTGLYPLPPGKLLVAGEDLAGLDGGTHRRSLAVVLQEGRLFSGTLGENLLYGTPGSSEVLLRQVTENVRLAEEVDAFSEGFDTPVGEGGLSLSGGQRQRVGLGRALARGGSLWLLDDPFSHLDAATARKIWGNLRPLLAGKTVFLASGRVSLLSEADHILVLEKGLLREEGTHGELLTTGGLYARLARREQLRDELEGLG